MMFAQILDFISPRLCLLCDRLGADLCEDCRERLKTIGETPRSEGCSFHDKHRSVFLFDDHSKRMIHRFKYQGEFSLRRVVVDYFKVWRGDFASVDVILPVPLHINRLKARGFNQGLILAKLWGEILGKEVRHDLLERIKDTPSQTGLDRQERERNLRQAFRVKHPHILDKKNILLVDDVHTTGVTLSSAAWELKQQGAGDVFATSLAMVERMGGLSKS